MPIWVWGLAIAVLLLVVGHAIGHRIVRARMSVCPPSTSFELFLLELPWIRSLAGAEAIITRAGVAAGMSVLEVGCGPGRVTIPLARRVGPAGDVLAVDVQKRMIEKLDRRLKKHGVVNVHARHQAFGVGRVPVENAFDRALLVAVLGEIPDRQAAMKELFIAVRPGGVLSVTEMRQDPHYQEEPAVLALAQEAGFELVETHRNRLAFTMNLRKPEAGQMDARRVEGRANGRGRSDGGAQPK